MAHESILLDSDALVGWITSTDVHHECAVRLVEALRQRRMQPVVTNLVVGETATLFNLRQGQGVARDFLGLAASLRTIVMTETLHQETLALFAEQERKRTSYVHMANVVIMRSLHIPYLFAFDAVYHRDFNLPMWGG